MDWRAYAEQMALLARDLLAQDSVQATLDEIVAAAVKLVDGCDAAGILAVRKGRAVTLASCGDMVHECDRLQGELSEGPCFDLARQKDGERLYRIADMALPQPTWQRYAAQARKLGVGSMTGVLLYTDKGGRGGNGAGRRRGTTCPPPQATTRSRGGSGPCEAVVTVTGYCAPGAASVTPAQPPRPPDRPRHLARGAQSAHRTSHKEGPYASAGATA